MRSKPGVTTPAPALKQEKGEMRPNSEPRPGAATPAPALGQEKEETPPISEPWPEPAGPFQRSLGFSFLHSGAFETSPPNELKSLPWWEWQQQAQRKKLPGRKEAKASRQKSVQKSNQMS